MLLDNINLNALRVFISVYKKASMTEAAKDLHLTQSGVSQHIKSLEQALEVELFYRKNKNLYPTKDAEELYQVSEMSLLKIEDSLRQVSDKKLQLRGQIRIGLPVEFGNNRILPLVAEVKKKHRLISFHITYAHAVDINQMLIDGMLDFAMVDQYSMSRNITLEEIYREALYLCCHKKYLERVGDTKKYDKLFYEKQQYVSYVPEGTVIKQWFQHHYSLEKIKLNVAVTLMDVQGVAQCIDQELGLGILPGHLLESRPDLQKNFHVFLKNKKPAINSIKLAFLEEKRKDRLVGEIIAYFKRELPRINT